jgi:cell division protein FtsA
MVITGGGAMLKHLPQLMKFKTAMDVRIGYPNEHLAGSGRNEINQPMFATSVGLIIRGFDHLETYKKSFIAGPAEDFVRTRKPVTENVKQEIVADVHDEPETSSAEEKVPLTEKIKQMLSKMFEVEDQKIN